MRHYTSIQPTANKRGAFFILSFLARRLMHLVLCIDDKHR